MWHSHVATFNSSFHKLKMTFIGGFRGGLGGPWPPRFLADPWLLFGCVLGKLNHFGWMSGARSKLQHRNNFNHWKFLDLVVDLNYISFSRPNRNPNPTHLPKHKFPSPNDQFNQCISYAQYYPYMVWRQKFRKSEISLDTWWSCLWRHTSVVAGILRSALTFRDFVARLELLSPFRDFTDLGISEKYENVWN